jgi:hypothetical protein
MTTSGDDEVNWESQAEMSPTTRATLDAGVPMKREKFRDAYFEGQPAQDIEEMDPLGVIQLLDQIGRRSRWATSTKMTSCCGRSARPSCCAAALPASW